LALVGALRSRPSLEAENTILRHQLNVLRRQSLIVIGKDVLELVSSAMYVDPLTVYREYVQNAADAIDDAKRRGEIPKGKTGRVDIGIDPASRTVRIRDNGSGIVNRLRDVTPSPSTISMRWDADRRRDPTPNNILAV
jgi:hypothetical protein